MILGGGLITQALAGGGPGGGKVKPLSITENGTYNVSEEEKAEGYVGFAPVTVDVPQSSGFLTLEQLAALPTACSLSYGDYRTDVKIYSDNSNNCISSGCNGAEQYYVNACFNKALLCKVISKNNRPFYGGYEQNGTLYNQWSYVYDTATDVIHKVNLMEWELGSVSVVPVPQLGLNEMTIKFTYKYKYTYYDPTTDEQTSTSELSNQTSYTVYAVGNDIGNYRSGFAAPSAVSLYPSIAAELCRAEKMFYETFKATT